MNRAIFVFAMVAGLSSTAPIYAAGPDIALVGGDVYPVSGAMIAGGTVLIRKDRIVAVGRSVTVPDGTRVIDCKGKRVTPGFVDIMTQIGLVEISLESSTIDGRPRSADPIRAALRVDDAIDVRSSLVGVARRQGVTSVASVPSGGLISGRSSWVDLVGPRSVYFTEAVSEPLAMHLNLGEFGARAVKGSRAAAFGRVREVFEDARAYDRSRTQFRRRGLYVLSASRLDLEALVPVLKRKMPLIVHANRASDISSALSLAEDEGVAIAVHGAAEGWMVADTLARANVPVIVDPFANLPFSFESRHARTDNVAVMARAGVKLAFTTDSSHNVGGLRFAMGHAVRTGVPPAIALAAGTLVPAHVYGQDQQYGALAPGRRANVVVWSGDPFEPSTYAEMVLIRGEIQSTKSRQTQLAKRYLRKLKLSEKSK